MPETPALCLQYGLAPYGLSRPVAASYIGLGVTLFDRLVADGRMPRPRRIDGRLIWIRTEIEKALAELPYDGAPADTRNEPNAIAAIRAARERSGKA